MTNEMKRIYIEAGIKLPKEPMPADEVSTSTFILDTIRELFPELSDAEILAMDAKRDK